MELSTIQSRILGPFAEETISCLKSMAGLESRAGDGFPDELNKFRFKGYAVAAETFGLIEGKVLMHHYIETALAIGNRVRANVLGDETEATQMDEAVGEALAEFGNTAIGLAMRKLTQANLGIKFKPPYFINSTDDMQPLLTGVREIISIPIHVENVGRFYFNYLLHSKTEG